MSIYLWSVALVIKFSHHLLRKMFLFSTQACENVHVVGDDWPFCFLTLVYFEVLTILMRRHGTLEHDLLVFVLHRLWLLKLKCTTFIAIYWAQKIRVLDELTRSNSSLCSCKAIKVLFRCLWKYLVVLFTYFCGLENFTSRLLLQSFASLLFGTLCEHLFDMLVSFSDFSAELQLRDVPSNCALTTIYAAYVWAFSMREDRFYVCLSLTHFLISGQLFIAS